MKKLDIGGKCASTLLSYLLHLREDERWHYDNAVRQEAIDIAAQQAGRVRLLNFLLMEVESNLETNEEL